MNDDKTVTPESVSIEDAAPVADKPANDAVPNPEIEKLHKDELKEFEDNKFKVLQDLKNRGLEVKFSCDEKYHEDNYQFKLKDKTINIFIVTDYPTGWTILSDSTEYETYNAIDVITLLEVKLGRPLMEEDFIGEVLDTINKKPN